ncbi:hypothetical protein ACQCWJ_12225, partial [Bacillus thuringiensis]
MDKLLTLESLSFFSHSINLPTNSHLPVKCTPIVRHSLTIGGAFFMAKFSSKEKIQAVKRYLDGTESGKT